jgi:hypothetical protein
LDARQDLPRCSSVICEDGRHGHVPPPLFPPPPWHAGEIPRFWQRGAARSEVPYPPLRGRLMQHKPLPLLLSCFSKVWPGRSARSFPPISRHRPRSQLLRATPSFPPPHLSILTFRLSAQATSPPFPGNPPQRRRLPFVNRPTCDDREGLGCACYAALG